MQNETTNSNEHPLEPLVRWRADRTKWEAIQVNCPNGLYPNYDADGEKIFDNTHFKTKQEAVENLERKGRAYLSIAIRNLKELEQKIANAKEEVVKAGIINDKLFGAST